MPGTENAPSLTLVDFREGRAPDGDDGAHPHRPEGAAGAGDARAIETALRRFCLGGAEPADGESAEGFVPAALWPWLARGGVQGDYPLVLLRPDGSDDPPAAVPLVRLLREAVASAPDGAPRGELEKTAPSLERRARELFLSADGPVRSADVLARAASEVVESVPVSEEERARLREAWESTLGGMPDGEMLDFDDGAGLRLLLRAARHRLSRRHDEFHRNARDLARRARELLRNDAAREEGPDPEVLRDRMSVAGAGHLDAGRFAEITKHRHRGEPLGPERRRRLEEAASILEGFDWSEDPYLVIVHDGSFEGLTTEATGWESVTADDPCAGAVAAFEERAAMRLAVFRAVRVVRLELTGKLDPSRHLPAIERLDAASLREEELLLLPVVAALDTQERILTREAGSLSRLLLSRRPVQLLVTVEPGSVPTLTDPDVPGERPELGYLGLAHRSAFVQQSSAAHPDHLFDGLLGALAYARPALHVLARGAGGPLDAEAALESRAHPFFRYDPQAGSTWAGRLDFTGNPSPESDWTARRVTVTRGDDGEETIDLPFTFGDYALLETDLDRHYRPVPDGCPESVLVPLDEWLDLGGDDALRLIPFVWGVDGSGNLRRLAVTRRLGLATRQRRDYWHTLQELSGVKSSYVIEAVARVRAEEEARWKEEREALEAAHREEIERVGREAVEAAMGNLARNLLELEPGAVPAAPPPPAAAAPAAAAPAAPPSAPAPPAAPAETVMTEPPSDDEPEDPWVDSALCTSCNDCININPRLFKYDANKQATIGDPDAGTYAQLVQAAEKCPARCIHPGTPRNPDEKNLDNLRERARPFR